MSEVGEPEEVSQATATSSESQKESSEAEQSTDNTKRENRGDATKRPLIVKNDTPTRERSQREKKNPKQYLPELAWQDKKRTWEAIILDGEGTPLGSLFSVNRALDDTKSDDPLLKKLHSLMFGTPGQKATVKKDLKLFKGIPLNEQHLWMEQMRTKLSRMNLNKEIKPICRILDIEPSNDQSLAIQRIVHFLMRPSASENSGRKTPTPSKKSSTANQKRIRDSENGDDDGAKPKKRISNFLYFASVNRERVKEKHPEYSFPEIGRHLGKLWAKLTDEEKASWKLKAEQSADSSSPRPAKVPKQRKSSTSSSSKASRRSKEHNATKSNHASGSDTETHDDAEEEPQPPQESEVEEEEQAGPSWPTVQAKISEIMAAGDLDTLSIKKIKEELSGLFGATYVANNGSLIKEYITKRVSEDA